MYRRLFESYERLAGDADAVFEKIKSEAQGLVRCRQGCADCCHAAFGLFLIEAAYLQWRFQGLDRKTRRPALTRCSKADRELEKLQKKFIEDNSAGHDKGIDLSLVRIRCPLLSDDLSCDLYTYRPITCRVYGIPTSADGNSRVCPRSGFDEGSRYTTFDLGAAERILYGLSRRMLGSSPHGDVEKSGLLVSVSKAIKTPLEDLIAGRL
ncbi:MAG: hypothetical protein C4582_01735 [Desulfobacteraceae bacterium]|jgi:Fe-S-cluster containining protein|nr:MAG: hypothetical protein C4582_01735 [Desulfobacteraceae bacterium]